MNIISDVAPPVAEVPVIQQPPEVSTVYLGGLFLLAMPMLAITKIVCDRILPLMPFGHFLEG